MSRGPPPGINLFRGKEWNLQTYRYIVLLITFVAYVCYHASRKPTGIVKSVLCPDAIKKAKYSGWAPFNGPNGVSKLGEIDVAFLACYSLGMYVAGHLGDSLDLRLFLTMGMIGSGIFVGLFGLGYFMNVHEFWFYLVMQMIAGLFQATGWPSVVAVIGNWFGKRKRGLIMGVWNAHTSVGNISGSLLAASVLDYGWGWSFVLLGLLIIFGGFIVFLFLPAYPEDVGFCYIHGDEEEQRVETVGDGGVVEGGRERERERERENQRSGDGRDGRDGRGRSIGLFEACMIPGVITFSLCLFFAKLVAYTFLYWLPFYLTETEIGGKYMSVKAAGNLSTLFDVGGIFGGILAGYMSDKLSARAITAASFMYAAIPAMLLFRTYGNVSMHANIGFMMVTGLLVNGPYSLITTAVSADLGTHKSLKGDSRALATVTAIIDGTGSVGAAIGPLLTGFLSTRGWDDVFMMLVLGAFVAGLLLSPLILTEIKQKTGKTMPKGQQNASDAASQPLLQEER